MNYSTPVGQISIDPFLSIVGFILLILIFFIFRELLTWYWKINKIVDSLDEITALLRAIGSMLKRAEKDTSKEEDKETKPTKKHSNIL